MTNTNRLNQKIDASGLRRNYIAEQLGINPYTLALKIKGDREFKAKEIGKLREILNIEDMNEFVALFFA